MARELRPDVAETSARIRAAIQCNNRPKSEWPRRSGVGYLQVKAVRLSLSEQVPRTMSVFGEPCEYGICGERNSFRPARTLQDRNCLNMKAFPLIQ